MKADPTTKNIPILMLTAVGSETGMELTQELDGYWMKTDDYANKPLLPEDLVKKINELWQGLQRDKLLLGINWGG